jgi:hypothetical protein
VTLESELPHGTNSEAFLNKTTCPFHCIIESGVFRTITMKNRYQSFDTRNRPRNQLSTLLKGQREIGHIGLHSPIIA